jgi:uncharacterized protein (TIGR02246 family)
VAAVARSRRRALEPGHCLALPVAGPAATGAFLSTSHIRRSARGERGAPRLSRSRAAIGHCPKKLDVVFSDRNAASAPGSSRAMTANHLDPVRELYESLLRSWNTRDANQFASHFERDCICVGFDGTEYCSAKEIASELAKIFRDHPVAAYVWKIRDLRQIDDRTAVLRAAAGMLPPGSRSIKPERNVIHVLVAHRQDDQWRIASYQNTPARYDGRPEAVEAMTAELQALV